MGGKTWLELMEKYFIIDEDPRYIGMSNKFPLKIVRSGPAFSEFMRYIANEHAKVFNLKKI